MAKLTPYPVWKLEIMPDENNAELILNPLSRTSAAIGAAVNPLVAVALANPAISTIVSAATASAVTAEVTARNLVDGTSPRLLEDYEKIPGFTAAVYAKDDRRNWLEYNDVDGGPTDLARALWGASGLNTPDQSSRIAPHFTPTRQLATFNARGDLIYKVPDPKRIVVRGESHMGGTAGGTTPAQRWSTILGTLLPAGTVVDNVAFGGSNAEEAAVVAGALALPVTINADTIPASGPVITMQAQSIRTATGGSPNITVVGRLTGAVAGATVSVPGSITYVPATAGRWDFTRTTAGSAINMTNARFMSDDPEKYAGWLTIMGSGINDNVSTPGLTQTQMIDRAVGATVSIVEAQRTMVKRVLLLGSLTRTIDTAGTSLYNVVVGIHRELSNIYDGTSVIAAGETSRQYVNRQLIYDMGITPTSTDLAQMAADTIPQSVTVDGQHLAIAAHPFYAAFVKNLLTTKGLV